MSISLVSISSISKTVCFESFRLKKYIRMTVKVLSSDCQDLHKPRQSKCCPMNNYRVYFTKYCQLNIIMNNFIDLGKYKFGNY